MAVIPVDPRKKCRSGDSRHSFLSARFMVGQTFNALTALEE
jgi:hypothetical protein